MIHILIGACTTAVLIRVIQIAVRRKLDVKWWQWLLVALEYAYVIFVLEVIAGFVEEGAVKGALVMGTILGFLAVIGAFLLARFIFRQKSPRETPA
jgi:predicted anti-sigma-YlaC factor YlaD